MTPALTGAYGRLVDALRSHGSTGRADDRRALLQCPAHEDRNPSLSLTATEGRVLMYCHAGCTVEDVLASLGLGKVDLFDEPRGVTYHYDDGRHVHRSPDKRFSQAGNTTSRPQLYRLSRVRHAIAEGRPVYLVEGEQDVHAVEAAGEVATTAPMGSSNFGKVDVSPLAGADVVAVVDRDGAGARWADDVRRALAGVARSLAFRRAGAGKDAANHVAAGLTLDQLLPYSKAHADDDPIATDVGESTRRQVVLTAAAEIAPRRVRWLWDGRIALGTLSLLAGREGVGKSTAAYWLAARITREGLPGEYQGAPHAVLVCATEDSWAHTIVPRLIAAGADLSRVYRVEVIADAVHVGLSLPRDIGEVTRAAEQVNAALLLLDPLMSRLDASLDSHRDHEVRLALEPLARFADEAGLAVLGLIHHNKSGSTDPLQLVMGSRAFSAVARSVHTVIPDPDDDQETRRLFGTPKNNLGRTDLPTLAFRVVPFQVDTDDGATWTGTLQWCDDSPVSIGEAMRRAAGDAREDRGAAAECTDWLRDHLSKGGGCAESGPTKRAAKAAGHSDWALRRARERLGVVPESRGFPRVTVWSLPESLPRREGSREDSLGETLTTTTTTTTESEGDGRVGCVGGEETPRETAQLTAQLTDAATPGCACGKPLSTPVQRQRGVCNRCWVAGRRSA